MTALEEMILEEQKEREEIEKLKKLQENPKATIVERVAIYSKPGNFGWWVGLKSVYETELGRLIQLTYHNDIDSSECWWLNGKRLGWADYKCDRWPFYEYDSEELKTILNSLGIHIGRFGDYDAIGIKGQTIWKCEQPPQPEFDDDNDIDW